MTFRAPDVTLRPFTQDDLGLLRTWLTAPHVRAWWGDSPDAQLADTEQELRAGGPSVYRIAELAGRPVGFLFRYAIDAYPEYVDELTAAGLDVPAAAWSVDYLLGEADMLGQRVGTAMLIVACRDLWAAEPDARCVIVPVYADNVRSWRVLQSAGFSRLPGRYEMEPDVPGHDRRHVVSRLDRPPDTS